MPRLNRSTIAACIAILLFAAVIFAARVFVVAEPLTPLPIESKAKVVAPPEPLASPSPQQVSVELLTLTPRGFEPNQIRRPAGRVIIVVVNRSEQANMTLRLLRENGTVLGQVPMPRNRRRWTIPVNLPAGSYRIVDANRAGVVCNIEITP